MKSYITLNMHDVLSIETGYGMIIYENLRAHSNTCNNSDSIAFSINEIADLLENEIENDNRKTITLEKAIKDGVADINTHTKMHVDCKYVIEKGIKKQLSSHTHIMSNCF